MVYGGGIDIQSPNEAEGIVVISPIEKSVNDAAAARIDEASQWLGLKTERFMEVGTVLRVSPALMQFKPLTSEEVGPSWLR